MYLTVVSFSTEDQKFCEVFLFKSDFEIDTLTRQKRSMLGIGRKMDKVMNIKECSKIRELQVVL